MKTTILTLFLIIALACSAQEPQACHLLTKKLNTLLCHDGQQFLCCHTNIVLLSYI